MAITFVDRDDDKTTVQAKVGDTLLDVAKDNDIDLEGIRDTSLFFVEVSIFVVISLCQGHLPQRALPSARGARKGEMCHFE